MPHIKVRFEINRGRTGAPLGKLGNIARVAEKFLTSLASDVEIDVKAGEWLAVNFENGSVCYDVELQSEISTTALGEFNRALEILADYDPDTEGLNGIVSPKTVKEYSQIGTILDPDEVISIGHYGVRTRIKPILRQITYQKIERVRKLVELPFSAYGAVQGVMATWRMATNQFVVRELSTQLGIRCSYKDKSYNAVANAVQARNTVLHVSGEVLYDRGTEQISELRVEEIEQAAVLSPGDFDKIFGSMPDFTDGIDTEDYLDQLRMNG